MSKMESKSEIERIREAYDRRKESIPPRRYSFFNPANLFMVQRRDREIIKALKQWGITSLEDKRILDIGCGKGGELLNFIRYGARSENLFGIDLLQDRIDIAKTLNPNVDFRCGDAANLPYEDTSFDIVMQFTVFTSILDAQMRHKIANEMIRVLGYIRISQSHNMQILKAIRLLSRLNGMYKFGAVTAHAKSPFFLTANRLGNRPLR